MVINRKQFKLLNFIKFSLREFMCRLFWLREFMCRLKRYNKKCYVREKSCREHLSCGSVERLSWTVARTFMSGIEETATTCKHWQLVETLKSHNRRQQTQFDAYISQLNDLNWLSGTTKDICLQKILLQKYPYP